MLTRPTSDDSRPVDPDQVVVGKCLVCKTVVSCRRSQCRMMKEPGVGEVLCAPCPKVHEGKFNQDAAGNPVPATCGMRVRMSATKKKEQA